LTVSRLNELVQQEIPLPDDTALDSAPAAQLSNGVAAMALGPAVPPPVATLADAGAGGTAAAGDAHESPLEESYELVPRADADADADTPVPTAAALAAPPHTNSWSDEPVGDMSWSAGEASASASAATGMAGSSGDGFLEVSHQRGGRARGGRGGMPHGPRGGHRGRGGFRGEHRGGRPRAGYRGRGRGD
jgi:hypothetical protein